MHFGIRYSNHAILEMTDAVIEDILMHELRAVCVTCAHRRVCVYRKISAKTIIQCELLEADQEELSGTNAKQGLCMSCDNADHCALPGRAQGAWHCNEFV